MKAIIQKDLRENLKIALIALILFSLLLLQAYQACGSALTNLLNHNRSLMVSDLHPLLSQTVLTEVAFFCAIFGAALGWLQTRNEAHRDLWAFLVHRPVSRSEIFKGKVAAGLCLYVFGAGLPLLVLTLVVATPGHIPAPFEWPMVLPVLAIFLTGVVYYFAGLLTGLRQARWYGSKWFGVAWGALASASAFSIGAFWLSVAVTVLATSFLALATWGAYQTGGYYRGQPAAAKLGLIAAMLAGSILVSFVIVGLTVALVLQPFFDKSNYQYTNVELTRDGKIYKVTYQDNEVTSVVDQDGQPVIDPKTGRLIDQKELNQRRSYGQSVASRIQKPHLFDSTIYFYPFPSFFDLWGVTDKQLWYVDRHGQLIGYDGVTRRFLARIEPHSTTNGPVEKFTPLSHRNGSYYYNSYYNDLPYTLASTGTVYHVDLKSRTADPIYSVTKDDEIGGFADATAYTYIPGETNSRSRPKAISCS
jgi:MFS family permease